MSDDQDFQPGVSDPNDFSAQEAAAAVAAADAAEAERIKALEDAGKQRKTVLEAEPTASSPTDPTLATKAALDESQLQGDTEPAPEDTDRPQVGDVIEPDGDVYPDDGYTHVVVSTDGLPTEDTKGAEEAKAEEPVVFA